MVDKKHSQSHILLILALCVGFSAFACTKSQSFFDIPHNYQDYFATLVEEDVYVDDILFEKDAYIVSFSNGERIGFYKKDVTVVTIDEHGYWCLNGVMTNLPLEQEFRENDGANKERITIIEDYTHWSFVFKDGNEVVLKKFIFTSNADLVVRGINHRGYNLTAPENTLPAYRLSRLMGFNYAEADIHFTSDGVPVLLHDNTIDRTSNGRGIISDYSWADVCLLDFGSWKSSDYVGTKIPSLNEFLQLCQQIGLIPYLELKTGTRQQIYQIVSKVAEYGLSQSAVYISFTSSLLNYVSEADKTATLGLLCGTPLTKEAINTAMALRNGFNSVFIDSSDYSDTAVVLCQDAGIPLEVWTLNSEVTIKSLSPYISGVTSDYLHAGRL